MIKKTKLNKIFRDKIKKIIKFKKYQKQNK
jgi:hypothetical protein